jgi:hypothetical protein
VDAVMRRQSRIEFIVLAGQHPGAVEIAAGERRRERIEVELDAKVGVADFGLELRRFVGPRDCRIEVELRKRRVRASRIGKRTKFGSPSRSASRAASTAVSPE